MKRHPLKDSTLTGIDSIIYRLSGEESELVGLTRELTLKTEMRTLKKREGEMKNSSVS